MKQASCPLVAHVQIQKGGEGVELEAYFLLPASLMTMRQANPMLLAQLLCKGLKTEITDEAEPGQDTTKFVLLIFSERICEGVRRRKGMMAANGLNLRMARRFGKGNE